MSNKCQQYQKLGHIAFSFMQEISPNLRISMLSVMTELPNSGLIRLDCNVVEDLAGWK